MASKSAATTILTCALVVTLAGCKSYVIDFDGKLPDGAVLAPQPTAPPPQPPEPLDGSSDVAFMDSTTAQLEGCRVITSIRLAYQGQFEDGIVKLRNTAVQINANRMIPLRFIESSQPDHAPHHLSAKMVRCPDAKEGVSNG